MNQPPPTRRLSTGTLFFKKVFPPLMIAAAVAIPAVSLLRSGGLLEVLPVSAAMIAASFITRVIGQSLADEVLDGGDHLIVRKDSGELVVPFDHIEAIRETSWLRNPPRLELILKAPGPLGRVIAFIPSSYSLVPFAKSAIFHELTQRLEMARRQEGRRAPRAQLERDLC
jgi:hypothetical protein